MSILRLEGVTREVGDFVILDAIDAAIALGDRIGLVGPNGAGKTTLLRIAAGLDEPDAGKVIRKRGLSLGMLAQEAHLDETFMTSPDVRTAVRHGAAPLERMAVELERLEHAGHAGEPAYAELQHQFETLGGYTLDQRVDEALSGLGFTAAEIARSPTSLSGGEQTRAALARLVVAQPDLLLLDEPTNHLDLDALEWLEEHMRRRAGSLLVASHDRAFLDGTVSRIWELRERHLTAFRGDYTAYHRQRLERDAGAVKDADSHAAAIAREKELVQRYRSHRKYSKMHEHEARLERLQDEQVEAPRRSRKLRLPCTGLVGGGPTRSGEIVIRIEDLVVGYLPGRATATEVDASGPDGEGASTEAAAPAAVLAPKLVARAPFLAAQRGERIGIVGPNGAGKTTLLRTIAGDLPPLDGSIVFGNNVQLGYLAQLRAAAIPGATVLDALLEVVPVTHGEARSYLARFLFRGDDVLNEVRLLSGGERSRLELALLGVMASNVYLLDEPTNHLDVVAREAIEAFLLESPATIIVVSHDRRFLETICERLWVVDDGLVAPFDGRYRAWREALAGGWTVEAAIAREAARLHPGPRPATARARTAIADPEPDGGNGSHPGTPVPARPSTRAPKSGRLSKDAYRRQRETLDAELTRLGLRKNHLELAMGDRAVQANFVELRRVTSELADVEAALGVAEDAWLVLEERAP
jgi:ATP-binding cassette, subfamily F, member 3